MADSMADTTMSDNGHATAAQEERESPAPQANDGGSGSLSPTAYAGKVREASRALLALPANADRHAGLLVLQAALEEAHQTLHLNTQHSQLRSALALYLGAQQHSPQTVAALLATHDEATRSAGASALCISAFVSLVDLSFKYYYAFAGKSAALGDEEDDDEEDSAAAAQEPLKSWAGVADGPRLDAKGRYVSSVPPVGADAEWEEVIGLEATRNRVREAWSRASGDVNEGHLVWDQYLFFELDQLKNDSNPEAISAVRAMFLARLRQPHRTLDKTFERFSRFVSAYLSPNDYEATMSSASTSLAAPRKAWAMFERHEDAVLTSGPSAWKPYLRQAASQKPAFAHAEAVAALFERAIAARGLPPAMMAENEPPTPEWDAKRKGDKRRLGKEGWAARAAQLEQERLALWSEAEGLWLEYIWYLSAPKIPASMLFDACTRAVRAVPASGAVWGAYLRVLARQRRSKAQVEEVFAAAMSGDQIKQTAQIVDLFLGRIDAERELAAVEIVDEGGADIAVALKALPTELDRFMDVYGLVSYALGVIPADSPDPELRLERLASAWAEAGGEATIQFADSIWETALKAQATNVLVYREAARYYARTGDVKKARVTYKTAASRNSIANKDELLREWITFEHVYGAPADVDYARAKQREVQEQAWAAWYKAYAEQQQQAAPVDVQMQDAPAAAAEGNGGQKRKADDEEMQRAEPVVPAADASAKKGKAVDNKKPTRDRENSSVVVSGLPANASEADVRQLFKECGTIAEVVGPRVLEANAEFPAAATVEFEDRSAIPAARTRDRKRVQGAEVRVSLGRECTLYVTNFPEEYTYEGLKELFAPFGAVYDIRLPSRKIGTSRRFCYVQYAVPESAQAALVLHGRELAPNNSLQVLMSDPSRRQARSDEHASERELYVSGLPRSARAEEVRPLFEACGTVEGFRLLTHPDGKAKGIAFVDMRTALEAQRALAEVNGASVGGKPINVSLASSKARPGLNPQGAATTYTSEERAAAIKVRGLPHDAQEARIQMIFEQACGGGFGSVRRVDWTQGPEGHGTATVIFSDAALAGKALLLQTVTYDDASLTLAPLSAGVGRPTAGSSTSTAAAAAAAAAGPSFTPRAARGGMARGRGRGRGGIGFARPALSSTTGSSGAAMDVDETPQAAASSSSAAPKTQDAFRDMLRKG